MINARNSQYPFKSSLAAIAVALFAVACSPASNSDQQGNMTANLDICENTNARFSTLANYDQQEVVLSGVVHGTFQGTEQLGGFFMSATDGAGAVFVADHELIGSVNVGDKLQVTGTLQAGQGHWQLHNTTEIERCGQAEFKNSRTEFTSDPSRFIGRISFPASTNQSRYGGDWPLPACAVWHPRPCQRALMDRNASRRAWSFSCGS